VETKKEATATLEGLTVEEQSALQGDVSAYPDSESRKQRTELQDSEDKRKDEKARPKRNLLLRILFWFMRKSVVPILFLLALAGGLYVGFVVVGKQPLDAALKWETWRHMYDLVFADS